MASIKMPHTKRDVGPDGVVRWYFRRVGMGKVRLTGEPGTIEFATTYAAALAGAKPATTRPKGKPVEPPPPEDDLSWLVGRYLNSPAFRACAPCTQRVRVLLLRRLTARFGTEPFVRLRTTHIRAWRDQLSATPSAANKIVNALRQVYAYAVEAGIVENNPARDVKKLPPLTVGGWRSWTAAEIATFEGFHKIGTSARLAMALLLYTAQRRSDVVRLSPAHIADGCFTLTQHKNRARSPVTLTIPIAPELQAVMDRTVMGKVTLVENKRGLPFSDVGFTNWFFKECKAAGLVGCSPHGLRKAAAAQFADSGASVHEIMSITGHRTMKEVERYTRSAEQRRLALAAMAKRVNGQEKVAF